MEKGIIYVYFNRAKYEKEGIEKYYVGQTIGTMEQRAGKEGKNYGWANTNCNTKFARSIRKWGWNAFEGRVLEEVYEEDLNELEKFYIEQFDSYKNGYNTTLGGEGIRGYNYTKEQSENCSKGQKKRFQDENEREKISEKMRVIAEKRFKDPKERERQSIASKKQFQDPEARKKASIAQKKRWEDPKERKMQSEKLSGEKSYKAKSVYCNELNIIFSYVKLAEKYCINVLNSKTSKIGLVCDGKRNFTGKLADGTKLTWKWKEDVDQETLDKAEYIDSKKYEEILSQNVNDCNK